MKETFDVKLAEKTYYAFVEATEKLRAPMARLKKAKKELESARAELAAVRERTREVSQAFYKSYRATKCHGIIQECADLMIDTALREPDAD